MAQAKNGDKVRVHYTGRLDDGSIFDSSEGFVDTCNEDGESRESHPSDPMEFVVGERKLIPKFEDAVIGLEPGQRVVVKIEAGDAYGHRAEEMVAVVERSEVPPEINPQEGQHMEVILRDGRPLPVLVTEVTETTITLDANHPLAGRDLTFDIKLVDIV